MAESIFHHFNSKQFVPSGDRTAKFDGGEFGAGISFFLVDVYSGQGPPLHRHAYPETWIVKSGSALFSVGGQKETAGVGSIVVVPPHTPHKFINSGDCPLNMVCIHAAGRIEQEDLEDGELSP